MPVTADGLRRIADLQAKGRPLEDLQCRSGRSLSRTQVDILPWEKVGATPEDAARAFNRRLETDL